MLPGAIWHGHFLLCPACPARTPRWTHPGSSGSEVQLFFNPMNIWYQMSNTDPKLTKLFKWVSVCKRFFLLGFAACLVWGTLGLKGRTQIQGKKNVKCSYLLLCLTMGTPPERSWFAPNQSSQLLSAQQSNLHRAAWAQKKKKKISPKITKNPIKLPTCFFAPKFDWVFKFPMKVPQQVEKPIKLQRWFPRPWVSWALA